MSRAQEHHYPATVEDFQRVTAEFKASDQYRPPMLFALGSRVRTGNEIVASVRFPVVNGPDQNTGTAAILMKVLGIEPKGVQSVDMMHLDLIEMLKYFEPFDGDGKRHDNIDVLKAALNGSRNSPDFEERLVATFIFDDVDPEGVEDSTLKLYGMSNRLFRPNTLNLNKIFTKLPNVAWIGDRPLDEDEVDECLMVAAFSGSDYAPHMIDKFPLYVHRINAVKMGGADHRPA